VLPLRTLEQVRTFCKVRRQYLIRRSTKRSSTYQQSCGLANVLLRRLGVLPTFLPLAVVLGDLVFIAGFEDASWCGGGDSSGGGEEEDLGELHGCLWSEWMGFIWG
jgi:hypothetical protein